MAKMANMKFGKKGAAGGEDAEDESAVKAKHAEKSKEKVESYGSYTLTKAMYNMNLNPCELQNPSNTTITQDDVKLELPFSLGQRVVCCSRG